MSHALKLFRTPAGWIVETGTGTRVAVTSPETGTLTARDDLYAYLTSQLASGRAVPPEALGTLLAPVERQEIWAAGVTYFRSRTARMEESKTASGGTFYDLVYNAERPELFAKAAAWRVIGPGGTVRIRKDATWNVPEPEFTLVLSSAGRITGYTIGNDMSSRDIEGANPLYLPQAKVYDGSCAIGPAIFVTEQPLPGTSAISIEIVRAGQSVFTGATTVSEMKRDFETLAAYLFRELSFPDGALLLTGTGVIPPDEFTLQSGDDIRITVEQIGTLQNTVA
jgi:2-dehydro-3-deoxy-D-arabinonate dehydratase